MGYGAAASDSVCAKILWRDNISQWFSKCGARLAGYSGKLKHGETESGFGFLAVAAVKSADLAGSDDV